MTLEAQRRDHIANRRQYLNTTRHPVKIGMAGVQELIEGRRTMAASIARHMADGTTAETISLRATQTAHDDPVRNLDEVLADMLDAAIAKAKQ